MVPKNICVVVAEKQSERFAAELISELRKKLAEAEAEYGEDLLPLYASLEPRIWGVGGSRLRESGVELVHDAEHDAGTEFKNGRMFDVLWAAIYDRQPHAVIFVGTNGMFERLTRRVSDEVRSLRGTFNNWQPMLIQLTPGRDDLAVNNSADVVRIQTTEAPVAAGMITGLLVERDEHFPLKAHLH